MSPRRNPAHRGAAARHTNSVAGPDRPDSLRQRHRRADDPLPSRPILSSEEAIDAMEASRSSVYAAIDRLRDADVLRPLTDRKRDQVWGASLILEELADLGVRIAAASG